ncbi:helix-turn-helix domain-containing protein [Streptomyces sp. CBMA123]|uniref:helix-turn-helix domain-containing protein n=1 Tax=Streptomyces sp. CBMA123 TaxID=1896313 RepID=UPI001661ABC2|nr:helix-turn-helix domain-containing protein [Streptomyces sp. CBMA123]MBD0694080.1 DNA-binding protein [Streptomyces sp. CBMA123]
MAVSGSSGSAGGRTFAVDVRASSAPGQGYDRFRHGWEDQIGGPYPAPAFTPGATGDFRISARAVLAHESVLADVRSESLIGTNGSALDQGDDLLLLHAVTSNAWEFTRQQSGRLTVPAGGFALQRSGPPTFEAARRARATVVILPARTLGPLIGDRLITGSSAAPEARLLLGHVRLVARSAPDLSPNGAQAAHLALVELIRGVLRQQPDATEAAHAPALAQAARDLADTRLADPELSPALLARELNVSVRTLHRAFAGAEETVAGYIRRRRLEHARSALLLATGRPSISELAAYWQFADSSHFSRAFKRHYGQSPAEFARASGSRPVPDRPPA